MVERFSGTTDRTLTLRVRVKWTQIINGRVERVTYEDSVMLRGTCQAPTPSPTPTSPTVQYEVTGATTTVDVTYENENQDVAQVAGAPVPWTYSFVGATGDFLYVSAQKDGSETGDVTCSIFLNGVLLESNTSTGAYVICTASDTL
jgi:hypothetical protein